MANLKVNNYHNLRLRINKDEYWDFFVNKDSYGQYGNIGGGLYDKCLISSMNLNNSSVDDEGWLYSDKNYTWENALSIGYTLYNISYIGVDNGLFSYNKSRISNKDFFELFQSNKLELPSDDMRLKLHAVTGNTMQYDYPLHVENDYIVFNGGFYQGFFKTECDKYQVLPSKFDDGDILNLEFTLKKCDLEKESDKTLNDKYPNNKGIFFYIGTRAENKWIYLYDKGDRENLEECTELGVDDYVENGEIDKKDYIIGNFYDVTLDFVDDPPLDIDNYTDFKYYYSDNDDEGNDECNLDYISDYLDIGKPINSGNTDGKYIDMSSWCCDKDDKEEKYILKPFFVGCGCPIRYKKIKVEEDGDDGTFSNADPFGEDGYIGDWEDLGDLEECTEYVEPEIDISDFEYETDNGFKFNEANWYYFYTDNKFLMFDRTEDGMTIDKWVEGTQYMYCGRKNNFKGNLFILMNRTKTGYTVSDIDTLRDEQINYYNPYKDLYNNALAFRITDKGEIGYRMLTIDCEKEGDNKTSIIEGYSNENIIPSCEWVTVMVRMVFLGGDKMKVMFYINGKLKYITRELPRLDLRALDEIYDKQEGVPYNISIGGGTQGLCETIQSNYMLNPSRVYPLEEYFGGTFIGYMKNFRIYNCFMEQPIIENNYKFERDRWQ